MHCSLIFVFLVSDFKCDSSDNSLPRYCVIFFMSIFHLVMEISLYFEYAKKSFTC